MPMLPPKAWLQSAAEGAPMLRWAIDEFFPLEAQGPGGSRNGCSGGGGGGARTEDAGAGDDHPNPRGEHATWVAFARDAPSTGEDGAGTDNNDGCGSAINAPSATKNTDVGRGTEGGGKWGRGRKSRGQRMLLQFQPSSPLRLSCLRRKTNGGWGSFLPPMALLQPRQ